MSDTYVQCTLVRHDESNRRVVMVEWVPKHLAALGKRVKCNGHEWGIVEVGQESADPRSAHECRT